MRNASALPWAIALFLFGLLIGYIAAKEIPVARAQSGNPSAPQAISTVTKKLNADLVDNVHAAKTPAANRLLALDANAQFPGSAIPNTLGHDLQVNNLKAGAPTHVDCNTGGDVCGDDDVVADDDVTAGDDVEVGGDLEQSLAGNGSVKAAVYAFCGNNFSSILNSFTNLTNATPTITITNGTSLGQCEIDFGFDLTNRYIIVQAYAGASTAQTAHAVLLGNSAPRTKIHVYRWHVDSATAVGGNGNIMVIVY